MTKEPLANKGEAPRLAGAEGFNDQDKIDAAIVADLDGQRKAFLTLRAEFALAGYELQPLQDGSFVVAKWGMVRALNSIDDAIQFAKHAGVRHG